MLAKATAAIQSSIHEKARMRSMAAARHQAKAALWAKVEASAKKEDTGIPSPLPDAKLFIVPFLEPEMRRDSFNALNPTPSLPPVIMPGSKMGNRPFLAQAGVGVIPSFLEVAATRKKTESSKVSPADFGIPPPWIKVKTESAGEARTTGCPPGYQRMPTSDQQAPCVHQLIRPVPVMSLPRWNPASWNQMAPGYNPLLPPHVPFGTAPGVAMPGLAVVPPSFVAVASSTSTSTSSSSSIDATSTDAASPQ